MMISMCVNYCLTTAVGFCFDLSAITASVTSSIEENKIVKDSNLFYLFNYLTYNQS